MGISDFIISAGLFSLILNNKLEIENYFGSINIVDFLFSLSTTSFWFQISVFLSEKWLLLLFSLFIFVWFLTYKRAVKNEMKIIVSLYSSFKPPHDWEKTIGKKWIPILSVGITGAFLGMVWSVDNIQLFCAITLFLNVLDVRGNNIVRQNLIRHFKDPKFIPTDIDPYKKFIMKRREIAEDYWIWKPQIERIGLMMMGVVAAFIAASSEKIFAVPIWDEVPYFMLIIVISANEITMMKWRIKRDGGLIAIDQQQESEERERTAIDIPK